MNATQLELPIGKPAKMTVRLMILESMGNGHWTRLEWLKEYCLTRYGVMVSETTISARLREPGLEHDTRARPKGRAVEYRLKLEAL